MPRFEPIVRNVTISREDMAKLLAMPLDEMDAWSPVNVVAESGPAQSSRAMISRRSMRFLRTVPKSIAGAILS